MIQTIQKELFLLQDMEYRDFQAKLLPTIKKESIIGVRTPALRKLAKQYAGKDGIDEFMTALPHLYFDEDQLHAFLISEEKNMEECIKKLEVFLPYINNWATCDQLSPKVFKKNKAQLLQCIKKWMASDRTFTVRFAIGMLMQYFLDGEFKEEYPQMVAAVRSEEYYVNMMVAWYFATALAKQYEAVLPYFEEKRLQPWTHNKTIQKAVESYRFTEVQKAYLRTLRIKNKRLTV